MKVFLIIVAVLALIIIAVMSLSATITLIYDNGWTTKIKVLFIEKDIVLSKILSFVLFPEKAAENAADKKKDKKASKSKKSDSDDKNASVAKHIEKEPEKVIEAEPASNEKTNHKNKDKQTPAKAPAKPNPIKKLWDDEGLVGIFSLVTNLVETANSAILTLIRGLHIYSLYVMIIVGGYDADMIGRAYGELCRYYYPFKGIILNQMKVDNYDDYIQPDFIAPKTEVEFQLIASISVGLLLKVALKAGFIFLKNLIKNKKGD